MPNRLVIYPKDALHNAWAELNTSHSNSTTPLLPCTERDGRLAISLFFLHSGVQAPRIREVDWGSPRARAHHAQKNWDETDCGNGAVIHSYEGHFDEVLVAGTRENTNHGLFVFFYAPWCPHSKAARTGIVGMSRSLNESGSKHRVVAVDAQANNKLKEKFQER